MYRADRFPWNFGASVPVNFTWKSREFIYQFYKVSIIVSNAYISIILRKGNFYLYQSCARLQYRCVFLQNKQNFESMFFKKIYLTMNLFVWDVAIWTAGIIIPGTIKILIFIIKHVFKANLILIFGVVLLETIF